ncbi:MAG: Uma2 family endonuclease [Nostoc sp.]|uniref:Uma2 family endonuclease n=1 Tax=Nostoc sp. TaxID=1180 RepID=UPI002FEEBA41
MIQALRKLVTFDEFVAKYPDNTGKRYELHDGVIVEMPQPTGYHEQIIVFLVQKFILEYSRISLPYGIPKTVLVKPLESESAYSPDVLILNLPNLVNEPLWKKESTVSQAESIPLVVEVVSSNWRDDYLKKAADYEAVGIPEYWIVDYAALGGRRFIGNPKQPTVSVYTLIEGEYQVSQFQDTDACGGKQRIISPLFPELSLTAEQIFQAGGYPLEP